MNDFTIISYPGARDNSLLSLTDTRSRYMLPFGGRFRVVDFTIRNSFSSGARRTIIYNNYDDGLEDYVNLYGPFQDMKFPPIKVVSREYSDIRVSYNLIMDSNTDYYVIYNGDNPSIIDFTEIVKKFKSKKTGAMLFRLVMDGKPSMAYKVLIADQATLLDVINIAIEEGRESPNIFEMIINIMVNSGISKSSFEAYYWPIKSVVDYYRLNRGIIWTPELFGMLYRERIIQSQIKAEGYAYLGKHARIKNSLISDFCSIDGTVEDSIIYPGVEIGRNSVVRNSIVLPFVKIGPGARITTAIIDESERPAGPVEGADSPEALPSIGDGCIIGSTDEFIKSNDFSGTLFNSITLIGKDCRIPSGSRIGGACYVASGLGGSYFSGKKFLYDGSSLIR
ncbi:MAG: hypothetical protein MUD12_07425 [Spirochaetes bacterium]|jgi:glucose-1-phosphate adenylyltransferase|nr:hypothetical protein [Spirochaetota bacterium]